MDIKIYNQTPSFHAIIRPKTLVAQENLNKLSKNIAQKIKYASIMLGEEGEKTSTKFYHVKIDENMKLLL